MASTALAAAMMLTIAANDASASVTVTIDSVAGKWVSTQPGSVPVTGLNTNEIRWGTSTGSGQSGYLFDGLTSGPWNVNQIFDVGQFTHFNNPIAGGSITGAQLQVDFGVTITNGSTFTTTLTSVFDFAHLETPNGANPCADGGTNGVGVNANGCADRVTFKINPGATTSVNIDGTLYVLNLTGFVIGGVSASEFWTKEQPTNTAVIQGVLTERSSVVPVPAALPIMLAALGGFGFAGYRRHRQAA
jgi:hypothetical protein